MTTLPGAILKLIPPGTNDPPIIPVGVVLHQAQSTADSLFGWFNGPSGGIESHLYVRFDGLVEQYRDFEREADAQGDGNSWLSSGKRYGFISIETEGMAGGTWTDAQEASLARILRWLSAKYGFPLAMVRVAQPSSPAKGGVGYHSLFDIWNKDHHNCPGAERVAQIPALLTEDDMFSDADRATLNGIAAALPDLLHKADGATIRGDIGHARDQILAAEDVPALAAALAASIHGVTEADVETALKNVLGSLS